MDKMLLIDAAFDDFSKSQQSYNNLLCLTLSIV